MSDVSGRPWVLRLLLVLLGGWIALSICMAYIASGNFSTLDPGRLRQADAVYRKIPAGERRPALRYAASELNRRYFALFNTLQIGLALVCLFLLWAGGGGKLDHGLAFVCLAIGLVGAFYVVPELTARGREIDFLWPRDPSNPKPAVAAFYQLHKVSVAVELIKLLLLCGLSARLVCRRPDVDPDQSQRG